LASSRLLAASRPLDVDDIVAALVFSGSALARDYEWQSSHYGNAMVGYFSPPPQKGLAIAFYAQGKGVGRAEVKGKSEKPRFVSETFGKARVSYLAPAK